MQRPGPGTKTKLAGVDGTPGLEFFSTTAVTFGFGSGPGMRFLAWLAWLARQSESMTKRALVTGAGSGVGRAVAVRLAREGWQVALVGRRRELLEQTQALMESEGRTHLAAAVDVGCPAGVEALRDAVLAWAGGVDLVVNAAGTNVPRRALEVLTFDDYKSMMDTNLTGAYLVTQAFLPGMRERQDGTIVNIVSDAGKQASPKAGPAYVMSKFGMTGLTQAINAEERGRGIRACSVFPGDIDTPILDKRPSPPPAEARSRMLQPEDVAECVMLAVNLPSRALVEEILIRPR